MADLQQSGPAHYQAKREAKMGENRKNSFEVDFSIFLSCKRVVFLTLGVVSELFYNF